MWTLLFFVMFFGLLASGMPIFLVLGACAAVLFVVFMITGAAVFGYRERTR